MPVHPYQLTLAAAALKGTVMSVILAALDIGFLKALAIAALSAAITGGFALWAAHLTIRAARETRQRVEDVAGVVGADKRATDPGPSDSQPAARSNSADRRGGT